MRDLRTKDSVVAMRIKGIMVFKLISILTLWDYKYSGISRLKDGYIIFGTVGDIQKFK